VELRHHAEVSGATVVDRASVLTTHLSELVRVNAAALLGREDVRALVELIKRTHPSVVEELTPSLLTMGEVQRILQLLLAEQVPIRDLVRIFEAMSLRARSGTDVEGLVEAVRVTLGAAIATPYLVDGRLPVLTFDPMLEQTLLESVRPAEGGSFLLLDGVHVESLMADVARAVDVAEQSGRVPVLVCSPQIRAAVRRLLGTGLPRLPVLSYGEVGSGLNIDTIGVVTGVHAVAV
jgi:flagellar biosynthesis protein FlhA